MQIYEKIIEGQNIGELFLLHAFLPMPRIGHQTENTDSGILTQECRLEIIAFSKDPHGKACPSRCFRFGASPEGRRKNIKATSIFSFCLILGIALVNFKEYGCK